MAGIKSIVSQRRVHDIDKGIFFESAIKNSEKSLVYYLCTRFLGSYVIFTLNLHHQHKILQTMKMLFLLLFLLIGLAETQAQSFTYHPLKGFHGDTISFLKVIFTTSATTL